MLSNFFRASKYIADLKMLLGTFSKPTALRQFEPDVSKDAARKPRFIIQGVKKTTAT
jgi:hypothetical protein